MAKGIIYKFTHKLSGMAYIGQTLNETLRIRHHLYAAAHVGTKNEGQPFVKALREFGIDAFDYERLYVTDEIEDLGQLKKLLDEKEMYYIEQYNTIQNGYNRTKGGQGCKGLKCSERVKEAVRRANTGRTLSDEHKEAVRRSTISRWQDEEYRKFMSERFSGENNPMFGVRLKGELNHNFGRHHSEETKRKISASKKGTKGHPMSLKNKEILSKMWKGVPKSEEQRRKISETLKGRKNKLKQKRVLQYSKDGVFIREWDSVSDAQTSLGICQVSSCAKGKRLSAGGYIWRYQGDETPVIPVDEINKGKREIAQVDDAGNIIRIFQSIREASNVLHLRYSGITNVLQGLQRKTGDNYKFVYINT